MHTFTFLGLQVSQNGIADVRNWGGAAEVTNMVLLREPTEACLFIDIKFMKNHAYTLKSLASLAAR